MTLIMAIEPTDDDLARVHPGDRITHIDNTPLGRPLVAAALYDYTHNRLPLVNDLGTGTEHYLYPDTQVSSTITVEREAVNPEPAPTLTPVPPVVFLLERERKALQRNWHYAKTLRLLDDGKGGAVDLRTVVETVNYANLPLQHSRTAGALEAFYGWVEKVGDYTWRLTPAGRRVLAALDQQKRG